MKTVRLAILGALAGVQSIDFMLALHRAKNDDLQSLVTVLRRIGDLANTNVRFLDEAAYLGLFPSGIGSAVYDILSYALIFRDCTEAGMDEKMDLFMEFVESKLPEIDAAA